MDEKTEKRLTYKIAREASRRWAILSYKLII